ncbi:MAG: type II secretion system F family protein [Candidatus Eisenbacteria sp.]|nr:type II secretion system F family protein [Candidatus Eisenbacteria bacterium]
MAIDLATIDETPQSAPEGTAKEPRAAPRPLSRFMRIQIGGPRKTTLSDLVLFTQQLALLLRTGNGLVPSIGALASQMKPSQLKETLQQVHERLQEGCGLSESLEPHGRIFDTLFVSIVRAGEACGSLRQSLERLTGIMDIRRRLHARIREAMTYPTVLMVIMTMVVIFMLTYMVPRFSDIFADLGDELPWTTRLLMGSGTILRSRWWAVLPIVMASVIGVRRLWKTAAVGRIWNIVKLKLPVVGMLYKDAYMFQMFSSLGLLLGSRVPHLEAIAIARETIRSARYEAFFTSLAEHVEGGRGMALAFQESQLFPETVKLMVSTAETSGALDAAMESLSAHYREELEGSIRRLSSLIEPCMLVIMGIMVGFVTISFMVPLFKLSQAVH